MLLKRLPLLAAAGGIADEDVGAVRVAPGILVYEVMDMPLTWSDIVQGGSVKEQWRCQKGV